MTRPNPRFLLLAAAVVSFVGPAAAAEPAISFNRDIRPILSAKCLACHGFDAKKREADLRLDTADGATSEHDGVRAIVPGDLAKSELWRRVTSTDEDERMPPADSKKTLSDQERELLKRWIEQGAPYQKHWAFEPIVPPAVSRAAGDSPIDAFLNEKMREAGLSPQPPAEAATLIRRASFALTGLPPTIEELEEFQPAAGATGDKIDGKWYEAYVDHLLSSPRFGEEMARHWLDVARYADTHGLHLDNERQIWAYRDWVVKALNDNLPFDQFTVWQMAGDLLPNPTNEQLVATGFNRCNVTTSEGGSISAEYDYRYAVERATAMSQAWLGLTVGCAVCHDHKYDPISAKEFYSLYAFFHSNADPAMDGNSNTTAPFLKLPDSHAKAVSAAAAKVEHDARAWLDMLAAGASYSDPAETKQPPPRKAVREVLFDDAFPLGSNSKSSSRNAIVTVVDPPFKAHSGRRAIRQAAATNLTDTIEFKLRPIAVPKNGQIECWLRIEPTDVPKSIAIGIGKAGKRATATKTVEWKRQGNELARGAEPKQTVKPGKWTRLVTKAADLGLDPGDLLSGLSLQQNGGVCYWDSVAITGQSDSAADPLESLAAWRKTIGTAAPPDLPSELNEAIKAGPKKVLAADEAAKLKQFYLAVVARPINGEIAAARAAWDAARTARIIAEESAPGTFIYRDLPQPRDSFVMMRGQYDKPGEKVEPAIPAILPQIKNPEGRRLTRLDLARWLVSAENPLTARVTVNRLWQQLFGTGIVKTSYDFGTQGEPPTHPELLDWLAADFRDHRWDVKRMVKQIVMTDAFRRSAAVTPEMLARDPANRFVARGARLRLDAEQLRDNALYVSGLINLQMGGPGVKPYQPPNIWEPVGYTDSNTRFYLQDHGPNLYRRSLYVFLKRTAPPPFMSNFDAPNREQVCTVRERSNTPLQALQLMNDTQHFEAARALAERALSAGGKSDESRTSWLYQTVLSRRPTADETALVIQALDRQRALYRGDAAAARQAIEVGESQPRNIAPPEETAAWAMIANLVLNLDETICRN